MFSFVCTSELFSFPSTAARCIVIIVKITRFEFSGNSNNNAYFTARASLTVRCTRVSNDHEYDVRIYYIYDYPPLKGQSCQLPSPRIIFVNTITSPQVVVAQFISFRRSYSYVRICMLAEIIAYSRCLNDLNQ